jgi:hypothetical protein
VPSKAVTEVVQARMGIDNVRVGMNGNAPLPKAYVVSKACILPYMSDIPFLLSAYSSLSRKLEYPENSKY